MTRRLNLELAWDRPAKALSQTSTHYLRLRLQHLAEASAGLPLRLAIAVDTSRSMEQDGRLTHARNACRAIARGLKQGDSLYMASYSNHVKQLMYNVPGDDQAAEMMEAAVYQLRARGVTRIDLALDWLAAALTDDGSRAARVALLITDGEATDDMGNVITDLAPLTLRAQRMGRHGTALCAVGIGNAGGLNTGFLDTIGGLGHGEFIYTPKPGMLTGQMTEFLSRAKQLGISSSNLALQPVHPGIEVVAACRLRPGFAPLVLEKGKAGGWLLNTGPLAVDSPADIVLMIEAAAAAFGARGGEHEVLSICAGADDLRAEAVASLEFTSAYNRWQELNTEIDSDRRLWEMNAYVKQLQTTGEPRQTVALLESIESSAANAGADDVARQAAKQLDDLRKTGVLNRHSATTLLVNVREQGRKQ